MNPENNIEDQNIGLQAESEKPPYIIIEARDAGLPEDLDIRHYPETNPNYEFLRFQIGKMGTRPETRPVFGEKNTVIGEQRTGKITSIYVLMAWGSSLKNAKEMFFANRKEIQK